MNILVTGNMGYVGPVVGAHLRKAFPKARLVGLDSSFFAHCLVPGDRQFPEAVYNQQIFKDVRNVSAKDFAGIDAVIHLAAISNDPMGLAFEKPTMEINFNSSVEIAKAAREAGVKSFVFASSCSVYGTQGQEAKSEISEVNPLTTYAKSKVATENELKSLASDNFIVTALRFATACGSSPRLRLDLVLNDFVASGIFLKRIDVLSDGSPWRPLIHVSDMARAFEWGATRTLDKGGSFLVVNTGCEEWNYQVKDLAQAVAENLDGVSVSINQNAQPDKRSYRVDFSKYRALAPNHQPQVSLKQAVLDLKKCLSQFEIPKGDFRKSHYVRLFVLSNYRERKLLDENLRWSEAQ